MMDKTELKKQALEIITELDNKTADDSNVDYKAMYYHLFNRVTDTINDLISIQQEAERMFIEK